MCLAWTEALPGARSGNRKSGSDAQGRGKHGGSAGSSMSGENIAEEKEVAGRSANGSGALASIP